MSKGRFVEGIRDENELDRKLDRERMGGISSRR